MFVALLLLSGDVEANPGPQLPTSNSITFASFNVRSAANKAALIHDIINDYSIDLLALQETWIQPNAPPAIKQDIAPSGFAVDHAPRPCIAGGPSRGGGLAVIHRDTCSVRSINLNFQPSSFELQSVIVYVSPPILLLNIYQPHFPAQSVFFDELTTVLANAVVETPARVVLCGDLNCPGVGPGPSINDKLDDALTSCGLVQHVKQPTRDENLLDIIATADADTVSNVRVVDCGTISDHCLVTALVQSRRPPPPLVQFSYRDIKRINVADFEQSLRRTSVFTAPADTVDAFAAQLQSCVTELLDKHAPLKQVRKRASSSTVNWLTADAIAAKRERRRLERVWQRSRTNSDRVAYRAACRRTNLLINNSRSAFIRSELESCTDLRQRWTAVKKLLQSSRIRTVLNAVDAIGQSNKFADYFYSKIDLLRNNISARISSSQFQSPPADPVHSGPVLDSLSTVLSGEVFRIIHFMPCKSSSIDFIPTALLKACPSVFSELIANLANLSFKAGCFPTSFKTAVITPLLKKPNLDPNNLANYRPVSNLNNI